MVHSLIRLVLRNHLLVLMAAAALFAWGLCSVQRNPIDAIRDLSEKQVTYPRASNLQGIEAISHLLERMDEAQRDLRALRERLRLYEAQQP